MSIIILLLRFSALVLSLLGYVGFFRAFCKIPRHVSYLFSLSVITCAMYFAGLAGALLAAAYVVFGLGFVLFLIVLLAKRFRVAFRKPVFTFTNFLFVAWFVITFVSMIQYRLIHYDNFSHWVLVVKQMLVTGAIPDAASVLIDFKNYPLGTSSFLYYVGTVVGHEDGVLLMGQALLIFACFYAMFGVIGDRKRFLLSALLGLTCAIISYFNISIRVNNLLVDYLLPLFALGLIGGITESNKSYLTACVLTVPILGMLLIIKSTGVFFAVPCILYLLFIGFRTRKGKPFGYRLGMWVAFIIAVALAFGTTIVWSRHIAVAFVGDTAKFSMDFKSLDIKNLSALIVDKTPEQVQTIIDLFFKTALSLDQLAVQGMIVINALALVAWLNARFGFSLHWKLLRVLILMDLLMVIYYIGILAFYLVSMPLDEALRLAGFERYVSSMLLFVIGAIGMCAVRDVERSFHIQQGEMRDYRAFKTLQTKSIYQFSTLAAFAFAILLLVTDLNGMNALQATYPQTLPAKAETVLGNRWSELDNRSYLLYAPDTDRQVTDDYLLYVGRYLLFAPNVKAASAPDEAFMAALQEADYLAIVESDDIIRQWMQAELGLPGEPGIYRVSDFALPIASPIASAH